MNLSKIKNENIHKKKINSLLKKVFGDVLERKIKVLVPEWWTNGREVEQLKYILSFMRDILDWEVDYTSKFNPISIFNKKYDICVVSGIGGSLLGVEWAKVIQQSNIPIFALATEGLWRDIHKEDFIWGWQQNKKEVLWTLTNLWNKNAYEIIKKNYPENINTYSISGSTGIDRYIIQKKKNVLYDIGIALNDGLTTYFQITRKEGKKEAEKWLKIHLDANEKLISFIKVCSDNGLKILIKRHPGELPNFIHPVVEVSRNLINVKIAEKDSNVFNAIHASKNWITQNSTTSIEASILGKNVFRVGDYYPCFDGYNDFPEIDEILDKLEKNIKEFHNNINQFDITKLVGFNDGLNHLRFICNLLGSLKKINTKPKRVKIQKLNLFKKTIIHSSMAILTILKIPLFTPLKQRIKRFSIKEISNTIDKSSSELEIFYEKNIQNIYSIIEEYNF